MMTVDLQDRVKSELATLQEREAARARATYDDYLAVVFATTDGTAEQDPAAVAQVLQDCGKTVQDLEADCQTLTQRREWRNQLDSIPGQQQELAELEEKIHALANKRAIAVEKMNREIALLCQKRDSLSAVPGFAGFAIRQLKETCWQPIRDELQALRQHFADTSAGTTELTEYTNDQRAAVETSRRTLQAIKEKRIPQRPETKQQHERQLAMCEGRLQEAEQRLAAKRSANEQVLAEIAVCEARMLEP